MRQPKKMLVPDLTILARITLAEIVDKWRAGTVTSEEAMREVSEVCGTREVKPEKGADA